MMVSCRSKVEHSESKQESGVQIQFTVAKLYCAPSMARIYQGRLSEHIKHGPALAPGLPTDAPF